MTFSRDGRLLIVGGSDTAVHVYDVASSRLERRIVAPGNQGQPGSWPEVVALSPDGSRLAVGYPTLFGAKGAVSIYRTATWTKQFDVTSIDEVEISAVAFSPDGARLAVGAEDGTAGVWSLATRQKVATYDGSTAAVGTMSFAPGGQSVLSASNDGVARVWHASGPELASIPLYQNLVGLSLTPHQLTVLGTLHGVSTLYFLRLPGGRVQSRWRLGRAQTAATLSPDGRLLATLPNGPQSPAPSLTGPPPGLPKGPVRIWSVAQRRIVAVVHPAQPAGGVAFSHDGRWLGLSEGGTANSPGTPVLVNIATGHTVTLRGAGRLPCLGSNPNDAAMSRNDRVVAIGAFCGQVGLWDATTGRLFRILDQGAEISAVDLTPDGSRLLVASWDSRATIYSVATGRPRVSLIGHTRGIAWGGFAADGSLVVTESLDHSVRVWNARTGQQLRVLTFSDNQGPIAFSPNGQEMAIVENTPLLGVSGGVRVFGTCPACQDPKELLALAKPHAAPANRLTVLERTVINGS